MIRHGERADNVDYVKMGIEIEESQDPPLTPDGLHEAALTGEYLKNYLKSQNFTNIIIESSPYLRSL